MSTAALSSLSGRMRPVLRTAVDTLQVAAALESSGVTDQVARDRYAHPDVFALAATLRTGPGGAAADHPGVRIGMVMRNRRTDATGSGSVGHGLIYLLPALSMPALLSLVGAGYAALALVVGAAVGWTWAVVASWRAYAVLERAGRPAADAYLGRSVLLGTSVGALVGLTLTVVTPAPVVVGVVAAVVTAAQLGTTLLFFVGRLLVLVPVLLVQGAVGTANLLAPQAVPAVLVLAVLVIGTVVLLLAGGSLRRTGPARQRWGRLPGSRAVHGYALGSVAFLLLPQSGFLHAGGGQAVALAGLFLTMGVVEWRGGALSARLRHQLWLSDSPASFRRQALRLATAEGATCAAATAAASVGLVLLLGHLGPVGTGTLVVAATAVVLAPVYLLTLVLANSGAFSWLASSFLGAAVLDALLWGPAGIPLPGAFVVATGVLLVALLVGFGGRPVSRFR